MRPFWDTAPSGLSASDSDVRDWLPVPPWMKEAMEEELPEPELQEARVWRQGRKKTKDARRVAAPVALDDRPQPEQEFKDVELEDDASEPDFEMDPRT